jgi:hypothetical protein
MSTELVTVWCKPKNGGRHRIATVVSDVVNGLPYYTVKYRTQATTPGPAAGTDASNFQTFAAESTDPLVDNASTTFNAHCPGCKAPIQLNSQQLWAGVVESQQKQQLVEIEVNPKAAIESDWQWQLANEFNNRPGGSLYPEGKKRLRTDPRRQSDE